MPPALARLDSWFPKPSTGGITYLPTWCLVLATPYYNRIRIVPRTADKRGGIAGKRPLSKPPEEKMKSMVLR